MTLESDRFSFSAQPQAIKFVKKTKYREDNYVDTNNSSNNQNYITEGLPINIMSDPRIIRGSTITRLKEKPLQLKQSSSSSLKSFSSMKSHPDTFRRSQPYYDFKYSCNVSDNINLDTYLVEQIDPLTNTTVDEKTQTDTFLPKPSSPRYVPRKTGIDKYTQVEDTSELFEFDQEVAPIVRVIVSKTIEQSLFELKCEDELEKLGQLQENYHEIERIHQQWVEEELNRSRNELTNKITKIEESSKQYHDMLRLRHYVAGSQFMQQIYPDMLQSVQESLYRNKIWKDSDRETCMNEIIPYLVNNAETVHRSYQSASVVLEELMNKAVDKYLDETIKYSSTIPEEEQSEVVLSIQLERVESEVSDDKEEDDKEEKESNQKLDDISNILVIGPYKVDKILTPQDLYRYAKIAILESGRISLNEVTLQSILSGLWSILEREIAMDACLINFLLPKKIHLTM